MRIGELAERMGVKASAIRFYESSGLLPQGRRAVNGYRDYGPEAIKRLQMILLAQRLGFPLETLRQLFAQGSDELPQEQVLAGFRARRAEIARLRDELAAQDAELQRLERECQAHWARGECLDLSDAVAPVRRLPARRVR